MGRIIVVEDNLTFSDYVCGLLESKGFQTVSTSTCNGARKLFTKMCEDDIVLADLRLNDGDGILLLDELRKQGKRNPYIIMTDYDEVPTAVRSMKSGAEDYIPKKLLEMSLPPLLKTLQKRTERYETPIHERQSAAFREIDHKIRLVAPTNMSVLVLGENGTGKEHIAEKIHKMSKRSDKPFVAVDCGLLSKELAASALFGHEKGAFTGADIKRKGYWEEADGGTLFLDEIGNLPAEVQQMMLRALETKRYRPIGGNKEKAADVRIIAATNEDMQSAVAEKRFRQDLFHRIKEYTLNIPPLRECREDIMPLADFFRELANKEFGKRVKGFNAEARKRMLVHPWGGNVRELKETVRSAVLFTEGDWVTADKMEFEETPFPVEASLSLKNEEMEKKQIIRALKQADGNRSLAAELLGIGRTTLYGKMKQYGIKYKE
ncbi:sigma-54 dependent transcriptional regulator [Bacteroides uniformis]|uniref:Sigma-54 dependent transcriptional regulator n=1 Tax=Bacteroides uniformis TaxID=820 RepID=A0AAW6GK36_BACUN|nr:sigma-54 dependent transcriptional regulator [Bacteroides uniformis]MDC1879300.1 sigma-54 dependent transcriptional regulator [Bacteroides uniformis]MDC1883337.1 sigma-54 dependent transcriptional regulator [Bacteroides uniformis]